MRSMNLNSFVFGLLLIVVSQGLMTRRMMQKKQAKQVIEVSDDLTAITQPTVCNTVDLSTKYNYSGIVRTGYLRVNKKESVLAFMFYGRKDVKDAQSLKNIPTVIWLNGGPGSSSQYGNMQELGPLSILREFEVKVKLNNYTWANNYNILFVDQPVGTGLSYADPQFPNPFVTSMDDVANDFYYALNQLYNAREGCFSSTNLNIPPSSPLFIFGESYAGKYVPAIAKKIVQMKSNRGFLTGLKGIGIGDGFAYPYEIMSELGTFSFHLGLLDFQERMKLQRILLNGSRHNLQNDMLLLKDDFDNAIDFILDSSEVNVYDISEDGDYEEFLPNYFGTPEIQKLYNLNQGIIFGAQADMVYEKLTPDFMKVEVSRVEYLLKQNIDVLIYNGQNDLIVQTPGTMKWVDRLNYDKAQEFRQLLFSAWKINGKVVGSIKRAGKLQFRVVNQAGHLVPMDRPMESLDMVTNFVTRVNV